MPEEQGLTSLLCDYAANLQYEDLPAEVIATAKRLVLDSLGAALAGTTMGDGCRETLAVVRASGGVPESSVLGTSERTSAVMAALANGATVHALNYDAIGARGGHPGAFGLTAPLAMAERVRGVDGREFIASLVAGVEVEMRAVAALIEAGVDTRQNFLEGQVLSYVGATLSAGRVLGLNAEEMDSALGLMLMQVSGTRQVVLYGDPPSKGIYAAFPNQGGVLSALMAKEGLEGRCLAIEGQAGLFNMFYAGVYAPEALRDGLGERFHILETVFKPWATSGMCHPFIDAALKLLEEHHIDPASIQRIHLTGHPQTKNWFEPVEERRAPNTAASAANSIVFGTAKALINGEVTLADFTPEGMRQANVLQLAQLMEHSYDASLDQRNGIMEVFTADGSHLVQRVDVPLGQPDNPLSDAQLGAKFRDCASHSLLPLSSEAVERAIELAANLEQVADVSALADAVCGRA